MALRTKTVKSSATANDYTLELRLTENSVSVENNTSSVSWSLVLVSGGYRFSQYKVGWSVSLNGNVVSSRSRASAEQRSIEKNGTLTVVSGTTTVSHNSDGTLNMACAASIDTESTEYTPGSMSLSGTMALTDIPRASTLGVANGTLGVEQTLTITRASTTFTHTLAYVCGGYNGEIGMSAFSGSGTKLTRQWTPLLSLAAQNTAGTTVSVTLTLITYNGSAEVGRTTKTVSMAIPESVKPTMTELTCSPNNTGTGAAGISKYVQNMSKLSYTMTAKGAQGSTISKYRLRIVFDRGGEIEKTGASGATAALSLYGYATAYATVTDSRGRTSDAVTERIYVWSHGKPKISGFESYRVDGSGDPDESGDDIRIYVASAEPSGTVGGSNRVSVRYSVRSNSSGAVVASGLLTPGTPLVSGRNRTVAYTVTVTATDTLGEATNRSTIVPSETVTLNLKKGGKGAAFGKYAAKDNLLDVAWDMNVAGRLMRGGKNVIKTYSEANSPEWRVLLAGDDFAVASLAMENTAFAPAGTYSVTGETYSAQQYVALPFPMESVALTGGGGRNGIRVSNVAIEGNVGAVFRLVSPVNTSTTTTLRLLMAGGLATPPDNPPAGYSGTNAGKTVEIAETYLKDGRWRYGQNWLRSGNSGNAGLVNDTDGKGLIECDTLVTLILRGLKYSQSPYANTTAGATYDDTQLPANLNNYGWVARLNTTLLSNTYTATPLVFAHQLAWAAWYRGAVFSDATKVRTGDLAFWVDHTDDRRYFGGVTHVALVSKVGNVPYLYEATAQANEVVRRIAMSDKVPQPTYFARIDYGT
jgi:hypothetical protein